MIIIWKIPLCGSVIDRISIFSYFLHQDLQLHRLKPNLSFTATLLSRLSMVTAGRACKVIILMAWSRPFLYLLSTVHAIIVDHPECSNSTCNCLVCTHNWSTTMLQQVLHVLCSHFFFLSTFYFIVQMYLCWVLSFSCFWVKVSRIHSLL